MEIYDKYKNGDISCLFLSAYRCGSTSLHHYLTQYREVQGAYQKEIIDTPFVRKIIEAKKEKYINTFDEKIYFSFWNKVNKDTKYIIDGSPSVFFQKMWNYEQLKETENKLIFVIRSPIKTIFSLLYTEGIPSSNFNLDINYTAFCKLIKYNPVYKYHLLYHKMYKDCLEIVKKKDNIHICFFEDLIENKIKSIIDFLNLVYNPEIKFEKIDPAKINKNYFKIRKFLKENINFFFDKIFFDNCEDFYKETGVDINKKYDLKI